MFNRVSDVVWALEHSLILLTSVGITGALAAPDQC